MYALSLPSQTLKNTYTWYAPGMKQRDPRIVNGSDSARDVCQKTDNPISKKTVPFINRKIDRSRLRIGRDGFWSGSGGFGSNRGTRVDIDSLQRRKKGSHNAHS